MNRRKKPIISLIAAIGENRELGKNNQLLWHIPEDLKRFRKITKGHVVIMGRKTFESIGKPLPKRTNIIITKDKTYHPPVIVCHSVIEAIEVAKRKEKEEIFIIGGGQIYHQTIPFADRLYLTIVEGTFAADTFFPDYSQFKKKIFAEKRKSAGYQYQFLILEK